MNELEPIALSALQHWAFCPRQCGLIRLEQAFDDNLHTLIGNVVHARVNTDTLRLQVDDDTRLGVPLHHLQALGRVGLSLPLMHRLADEAIALVMLEDSGRFKARLEGAVSGSVD